MSSTRKKRILILIDWYLPGYKAGGPIQSAANLVARLKDYFDFSVITADTDYNDDIPYANVKSDEWNILSDGTRLYYFSKKGKKFSTLKKLILKEQADVIHLNSLFSVFFSIYPLLIRKYFSPLQKTVLAPRGMLSNGALHLKAKKKKIFLFVAKLTGLYKNITWHASTELESKEIYLHFGNRQNVIVASNLTSERVGPAFERFKEKGKACFVYLSRIALIKNLLSGIHALGKLPPRFQAEFNIYGPIEDANYWTQCKEAILQTPPHVKINYHGPVANTDAMRILENNHFMILLTRGENFGHSIIESMLAGCPVVISDKTPWRDLSSVKAGWDIPENDSAKLLSVLTTCCEMDQKTYSTWSKASFTFAENVINNMETLEANKLLFE